MIGAVKWLTISLQLWGLCNAKGILAFDAAPRAEKQKTSIKTWGPYRPNLYFGIRPIIPETLLFGLMWGNGDDRHGMLNTLRDTCEQDDGMEGYGWTTFDLRVGGSQTIHDSALHLDLTTEFFKIRGGESWTVRVTGTPRHDAPPDLKTALVFHVALENAESPTERRVLRCFHDPPVPGKNSKRPEVACMGKLPELGAFDFYQAWDGTNKVVQGPAVKTVNVSEDKIWQAKAVFADALESSNSNTMLVDEHGAGNMQFSQIVFEGQFSIFYIYHGNAAGFIPPDSIPLAAESHKAIFSGQVEKAFPQESPFQGVKFGKFSQSLIANLLGGIGFFHGDELVDNSHAPEYEETDINFWDKASNAMAQADITKTNKTSLLSFVPSRPFFPRGFLWDEGFHLLPIVEWDFDLAILVLQSWLSLMDDDGWIAREQILGPEARSKVPKEFQTQYPHFANPPTFIALLLPSILAIITKKSPYHGHDSKYLPNPDKSRSLIEELFPLFEKHHSWFRRTQTGELTTYPRPNGANTEGYRWKGRTPGHCLTSGLDDYPRAEPPHPGELHVDALTWVGASADALRQAAEYLGEDSTVYVDQVKAVRHNIEVLHWDPKTSAYCDATIGRDGTYQHVCHLGYLSLMPLLLGHINESHPNLPAVLDLLSDPGKLWSPYGLRSLSLADENYGKDEDYWRGDVWMNLNVLAVLRLRALGNSTTQGARAQVLASKLRKNVVETVYNSWEKTGFVWEQYNDQTGKGQRSRAFTGWTAGVLLLMGLESEVFEPEGDEVRKAVSIRWVVPVVLVGIFLLGLLVFRRRVISLYSLVLTKFRSSRGSYRLLGERGEPHEIMNLDSLYESDTEEDGR